MIGERNKIEEWSCRSSSNLYKALKAKERSKEGSKPPELQGRKVAVVGTTVEQSCLETTKTRGSLKTLEFGKFVSSKVHNRVTMIGSCV